MSVCVCEGDRDRERERECHVLVTRPHVIISQPFSVVIRREPNPNRSKIFTQTFAQEVLPSGCLLSLSFSLTHTHTQTHAHTHPHPHAHSLYLDSPNTLPLMSQYLWMWDFCVVTKRSEWKHDAQQIFSDFHVSLIIWQLLKSMLHQKKKTMTAFSAKVIVILSYLSHHHITASNSWFINLFSAKV